MSLPGLKSRRRLWGIVGAAAILVGVLGGSALASAESPAPAAARPTARPIAPKLTSLGTSAGTNIGNAKVLTGQDSGSLASPNSDNWYVVYPKIAGSSVTIKVSNTTPNSGSCIDLVASYSTTTGSVQVNPVVSPNTSFNQPIAATGSDRYFVDVTPWSCIPAEDQPIKYTIQLQAGGGGTVPSPSTGSIKPSPTINADPPLQGATSYAGTLSSGIDDDWYALAKRSDTNAASIRVENTTTKGSTPCTNLELTLDDKDGGGDPIVLAENTAVVFPIASAGTYYLELRVYACANGGTSYRIEPEPGLEWLNAPDPPNETVSTRIQDQLAR